MSDDETRAELQQTLAQLTLLKERFEAEMETQRVLCQTVVDWLKNGGLLEENLMAHTAVLDRTIAQWQEITDAMRERLGQDGSDDWWKNGN